MLHQTISHLSLPFHIHEKDASSSRHATLPEISHSVYPASENGQKQVPKQENECKLNTWR